MAVLEALHLNKDYAGVPALSDACLSAEAGEVHALVGANGAGKSTLIKILSGALRPLSGSIRLNGRPVQFNSPADAQRVGIIAVYQELTLLPQLTVAQNIVLGREPTRYGLVDHSASIAYASGLLERTGFALDPRARTGALSVAEQQQVEIARALSLNSRVLILDEPTAVLSLPEQEKLFTIVRRLKAEGVAILFISHRMEEIYYLCDRATVFRDGRIIRTDAVSELEESDLIEAMVGHKLVSAVAGRRQESGSEAGSEPKSGKAKFEPLLEVLFSHAERSHQLTLERGEILGIAGFVGSGRTSLARAIIGCDHAMPVDVRLDGKAITIGSPAVAACHGLVYITEDRKREGLFGCLSVLANVSAGSLNKVSYGGVINARAERRTGGEILSQLRLKARSLDTGVASLSGGNQQKVVFARALLQQPRVLICDEPTRGVDVGAKEEIYQLLFTLAARGIGIMVISSEFSELLRLSDRIMVMRDGGFTGRFDRADAEERGLLAAASGSRS
jgi:ABC-type sugar transport system ATPase subunit